MERISANEGAKEALGSQCSLGRSVLTPGGLMRGSPKGLQSFTGLQRPAGNLEWTRWGLCQAAGWCPVLRGQQCSVPAGCGHLEIWAQSSQILAFSRKTGKSKLLYEISQFLNILTENTLLMLIGPN